MRAVGNVDVRRVDVDEAGEVARDECSVRLRVVARQADVLVEEERGARAKDRVSGGIPADEFAVHTERRASGGQTQHRVGLSSRRAARSRRRRTLATDSASGRITTSTIAVPSLIPCSDAAGSNTTRPSTTVATTWLLSSSSTMSATHPVASRPMSLRAASRAGVADAEIDASSNVHPVKPMRLRTASSKRRTLPASTSGRGARAPVVDDDRRVADGVLAMRQSERRDCVGDQHRSVGPQSLPGQLHHHRIDVDPVDDQPGNQRRVCQRGTRGPGTRALIGPIALNRWVTPRTPAWMPRLHRHRSAAVWPAHTVTPLATRYSITSTASLQLRCKGHHARRRRRRVQPYFGRAMVGVVDEVDALRRAAGFRKGPSRCNPSERAAGPTGVRP